MSETEDARYRQARGLALLLQLQRRARAAEDLAALGFVAVNETRGLVEYRQAALWLDRPLRPIAALSGVADADPQAPYAVWLAAVCRWLHGADRVASFHCLHLDELPESLRGDWRQWLPAQALWLPLTARGQRIGGLLLARESAWLDAEAQLLAELADAYAHAWQALAPRPAWYRRGFGRRSVKLWALGAMLALMWPLRLSVLAPAEIVPARPTLIRAPLAGVVAAFHVQPNQSVAAGEPLLSLENTDIANRLDVSRKALAVAEAEYRKTAQQAMFDADSKAEVAVLKARMDQHAAEVAFMQGQLARAEVAAPHAGVAIFADVHDWLGRPVELGERILMVADANQVELDIRLPIGDFIELAEGGPATVFLNVDPQHPMEAEVYSVSYQTSAEAGDALVYRVKARLTDSERPPRIGLKGTAKLYGERVTLFYYLFRRPLAAARLWLGW